MLSYGGFIGIVIATTIVIVIVYCLALLLIPTELFAAILQMTLINVNVETPKEEYIFVQIRKMKFIIRTRWGRLKFIILLSSISATALLVFLDGCVIATDVLGVGQICSDSTQHCYVFDSTWSLSMRKSFVCNLSDRVTPVNSSAIGAICRGYILNYQTTVAILNQLGICTSIIALSAVVFWFLCWLVDGWLGVIIAFISSLGGIAILVLISFSHTPYGPITFIVTALAVQLTFATIWIVQSYVPQENDRAPKSWTHQYYRQNLPRYDSFPRHMLARNRFRRTR